MEHTMEHIIDCRGLRCPQPVINTKKYFDSIVVGTATVIVDNEISKINVCKLAENNLFTHEFTQANDLYYIKITKENNICENKSDTNKTFTIVVSTENLGNGDDKLGALLMKSYLFALSESDKIPTDMLFLNSGVKLTTKGSDSLNSLKKLVERGTSITCCGTCLDFYNLKDNLAIGEIGNMYTIVEKMNSSNMTIKL